MLMDLREGEIEIFFLHEYADNITQKYLTVVITCTQFLIS